MKDYNLFTLLEIMQKNFIFLLGKKMNCLYLFMLWVRLQWWPFEAYWIVWRKTKTNFQWLPENIPKPHIRCSMQVSQWSCLSKSNLIGTSLVHIVTFFVKMRGQKCKRLWVAIFKWKWVLKNIQKQKNIYPPDKYLYINLKTTYELWINLPYLVWMRMIKIKATPYTAKAWGYELVDTLGGSHLWQI